MDPKNIKSGFAAMEQSLNGMKGWMFNQDYSSSSFTRLYPDNKPEAVIQGLERQAIIFDLFNTDSGFQRMHDETNNRIYQAFIGLDNYVHDANISRAHDRGAITLEFGQAFKDWYQTWLSEIGTSAFTWASGQVKRLTSDSILSSCNEDIQKAIAAFQKSPLYGEEQFRIDQSHLTWIDNPPLFFPVPAKPTTTLAHDEEACVVPQTGATTAGHSTTVLSTTTFMSMSPAPTSKISTTKHSTSTTAKTVTTKTSIRTASSSTKHNSVSSRPAISSTARSVTSSIRTTTGSTTRNPTNTVHIPTSPHAPVPIFSTHSLHSSASLSTVSPPHPTTRNPTDTVHIPTSPHAPVPILSTHNSHSSATPSTSSRSPSRPTTHNPTDTVHIPTSPHAPVPIFSTHSSTPTTTSNKPYSYTTVPYLITSTITVPAPVPFPHAPLPPGGIGSNHLITTVFAIIPHHSVPSTSKSSVFIPLPFPAFPIPLPGGPVRRNLDVGVGVNGNTTYLMTTSMASASVSLSVSTTEGGANSLFWV